VIQRALSLPRFTEDSNGKEVMVGFARNTVLGVAGTVIEAVAILLTLFHLGIKKIRLGPSPPAFVTPIVLDVLVKNFHIMPIATPDEDLKAILG
jgi:hydroxylamine reductase (hybrid-cluster protein)